jgi:hypothetical protein
MRIEALPVIAAADYARWQAMLPGLPATHAAWLLQHACALSQRPDAAEIAITPAEFHHYWQVHGSPGNTAPDAALLARCIARKVFLSTRPPSEAHHANDDLPVTINRH